jgi:HAD superfamily hydrolase (TIGR01509 family)
VRGLARRENEILVALIDEEGAQVHAGPRQHLDAVRRAGLRAAVVSSSRNCEHVLAVGGFAHLFDVRVDGIVATGERLKGKPSPDTYLAAAREVGASPGEAAVFDDALAGVEAGRAGRFGFVVGVDRVGQAEMLRQRGADVIVSDLAQLLGTS